MSSRSFPPEDEMDYCGCCGRQCGDYDSGVLWCEDCARHIDRTLPLWLATYFAQYDKPCPFT